MRGVAALRRAFVPWLIPESFESSLRFIESFEAVSLPAQLAPFEHGYLLPESRGEVILVPLPSMLPDTLGRLFLLMTAGFYWLPMPRGHLLVIGNCVIVTAGASGYV